MCVVLQRGLLEVFPAHFEGSCGKGIEQTDAVVAEVREPAEYRARHVPGALSVPQAGLALHVEELPRDRDLLVVCEGGTRSLRAAHLLKQIGFERVANLAGGTAAQAQAGLPTEREA